MNISLILMILGGVAFVLAVAWYFEREKISAWWARVRGTKGVQEAAAIEAALVDRVRAHVRGESPMAPAAAALQAQATEAMASMHVQPPEPWPRPTAVAPLAAPAPPAAPAAQPKESPMPDKGVVTAGALLSGWVLANWDTKTDPVPATRHADIMYLLQTTKRPGGNQVVEDVVLGSQQEINVVRNYAHTNGWDPFIDWDQAGGRKDWSADPAVSADVKAAAEASIKAYQAAHPANVHTYDWSRYRRA